MSYLHDLVYKKGKRILEGSVSSELGVQGYQSLYKDSLRLCEKKRIGQVN